MKLMKREPDSEKIRKRMRDVLVAGILLSCKAPAYGDASQVGVREYLAKTPVAISEVYPEAANGYPLKGKILQCRGIAGCSLEVYAGDSLLSMRINPEREGSLEIIVDSLETDGIVMRKMIDFNFQGAETSYQTLKLGESSALFNTDLRVRAERNEYGKFYITIQ